MAKREVECYKFSELERYAQQEALENCDYLLEMVRGYNKDLLVDDLIKRKRELLNEVEQANLELKEIEGKIKTLEKMASEMFHCQCTLGYVMEDLEKANEGTLLFNVNGEPLWFANNIDCNIKLRNLF